MHRHRHVLRTAAAAALLLAASSLTAACSARTQPPAVSPRASADSCGGADYHFTATTRTTVLVYLSAPHTVTTGGAQLPEDLLPLQRVTSGASSSAGTTDATRAYAAFARRLGRDDTPPPDTAVPPSPTQSVSPSTPGTYAHYRAVDVFTAHFSHTCGSSTAYGTVTTWGSPRNGDIQCGTSTPLPPHATLARTLACPDHPA